MTVDSHVERLRVPLWWWPVALALTTLMAAELHLGYHGLRSWLPYATLLPIVAGALWWLGRIRVRVAGSELFVDDARIPLRYVSAAEAVTGESKRAAMGPRLSPMAFVVHRPWVPGAVKVTLVDPADPTPYWIVSSRCPDELAAAIMAAARGSARQTGQTG